MTSTLSTLPRRVLCVALLGPLLSGCVKDTREKKPDERVVVATWTFPPPRPTPALRLLPRDSRTPERRKHGLTTAADGEGITAKVDERDPYLSWQLDDPLPASSLRFNVKLPEEGSIELFWASSKCPVFSQQCSLLMPFPAGAHAGLLFLDAEVPVRALRIDLPDAVGRTYGLDTVELLRDPEVPAPWLGRPGTDLESVAEGLRVHARADDPWLTVQTPGLVAETVTAIELEMTQAPTETDGPELFWEGACGGVSQQCAKQLAPLGGGALTHRATLGPADRWTGAIRSLRLDPGSASGSYLIRRIQLVRGEATR